MNSGLWNVARMTALLLRCKGKKMRKIYKMCGILLCIMMFLSGCASLKAGISELKGSITGNTYTIDTFDNFGMLTMQTHGENINMTPNIIEEPMYSSDGGWGYTKSMSSVMTITIDGHEMVTCGDTCIFYEDGLKPDVIFSKETMQVNSEAGGFNDTTWIAGVLNRYKNTFGKPMVVVVKSQTGSPIYAFSGKEVNWEVSEDLPKTTRLSIDGKLMYIHRGTFQLIDSALLQ